MRPAAALAAVLCLAASLASAQTPGGLSAQAKASTAQPAGPVQEAIEIGLSTEKIAITSNFAGTDLTIFGALDDADPQIQRAGHYDIIVVLVGPRQTMVVRRKSRVLGVWVNTAAIQFGDVPASYSLASTRSLQDITDAKTYSQLGLGVDYLPLQPVPGESELAHHKEFAEALRHLKVDSQLYLERVGDVQFISQTLFRATLTIPANVPIGTHRAQAYLFRNGVFIRETSTSLQIVKSGFENAIYQSAHDYSLLYGLFAVALAVFMGWCGRLFFRRD